MSFSAGVAYVDLTLGKTEALKGSVAAEGAVAGEAMGGKFKSGLFNTVKGLAGPIIGIMALDKLFEFVKGGAQDWGALQASIRQTNAVLTSTAGAAGVSGQAITDLTDKLSKKTAIDQTTIRNGENMLLTFTNVKNEVGAGNDIFNQATATVLDMSKALGQDTKNSAIQLGKALNDPIKGVTALQRVGVTFTEQQKDQIKTLVASGKTLDAQKIILAELNKEFGGSAAASATGGAKLSLTMKDLAMNLYGLFAPLKMIGVTFSTWLVTPIADGVAKLVPIEQQMVASFKSSFNEAKKAEQTLGSWDWRDAGSPMKMLAEFLGAWVGEIKDILAMAKKGFDAFLNGLKGTDITGFNSGLGRTGVVLTNIGQYFHDVFVKMRPFIEQWGPLVGQSIAVAGALFTVATVLPVVVGWISKLSIVVGLLGKAMGLLAKNPLLIALSLLVGVFYALYQASPKFREFIDNLIEKFGKLADRVLPQIEKAFNQLIEALLPVLEQLGPAFSALFDALMPIVSALLTGLASALSVVMPYLTSFISLLGDGIRAVLGFLSGGGSDGGKSGFVQFFVNAFNTIKSIFDAAVGWISGAVQAIGQWLSYMFSPLEPLIPKFQRLFGQIGDALNTVWQGVLAPFFSWLGPIVAATFGAVWGVLEPVLVAIGGIFSAVFGLIFDVVSAVFTLLTTIIRGAMEIISGVIGLFLDIITGNWSGVWADLGQIVQGFVDIFFGIIQFGLSIVKAVWTAGLNILIAVVQGVWGFITGIFTGALEIINSVVGGGLGRVLGFFRGLGSSVMNAIGDLGGLLVGIGQSIIDGFLRGLKAAWTAVTDFVGGIAKWISDHKGPISYDRKLLIPHGKAVMQSFLEGLQSESGTIEDWLGTFTDNLAIGANIGVSSSVRGAGIQGPGAGGTPTQVFNVHETSDANSTAMAISRMQTNAARVA